MRVRYYDLIELPGGGHVPAPIALKLVGEENIKRIPVARRKRDDNFFYCEKCGQRSFYRHYHNSPPDCDYCDEWEYYEDDDCANYCDWYLEWEKKEKERKRNNRIKEKLLVHLCRTGQHKKLRYIKSVCDVRHERDC